MPADNLIDAICWQQIDKIKELLDVKWDRVKRRRLDVVDKGWRDTYPVEMAVKMCICPIWRRKTSQERQLSYNILDLLLEIGLSTGYFDTSSFWLFLAKELDRCSDPPSRHGLLKLVGICREHGLQLEGEYVVPIINHLACDNYVDVLTLLLETDIVTIPIFESCTRHSKCSIKFFEILLEHQVSDFWSTGSPEEVVSIFSHLSLNNDVKVLKLLLTADIVTLPMVESCIRRYIWSGYGSIKFLEILLEHKVPDFWSIGSPEQTMSTFSLLAQYNNVHVLQLLLKADIVILPMFESCIHHPKCSDKFLEILREHQVPDFWSTGSREQTCSVLCSLARNNNVDFLTNFLNADIVTLPTFESCFRYSNCSIKFLEVLLEHKVADFWSTGWSGYVHAQGGYVVGCVDQILLNLAYVSNMDILRLLLQHGLAPTNHEVLVMLSYPHYKCSREFFDALLEHASPESRSFQNHSLSYWVHDYVYPFPLRQDFAQELRDLPSKKINSWSKRMHPGHTLRGQDCAVCYDVHKSGQKITKLPCGHVFHLECMLNCVPMKQDTCPYCRQRYI